MKLTRFDELKPTKQERADFDCGNEDLNDWLVRFAGQSMNNRDAAVYLLHQQRLIVGFFTLSAGSVALSGASPAVSRRAPDPVPMILLGRMGVDRNWQGKGLGAEVIRQAILRAAASANDIGARGLMLHAIDETARDFYLHLGFAESPVSPRHMMVTFDQICTAVEQAARQP